MHYQSTHPCMVLTEKPVTLSRACRTFYKSNMDMPVPGVVSAFEADKVDVACLVQGHERIHGVPLAIGAGN